MQRRLVESEERRGKRRVAVIRRRFRRRKHIRIMSVFRVRQKSVVFRRQNMTNF